jgi:integrase
MAGRRSNGEGSVSYDSRRKRYRAKVTIGWELDETTGKSRQITKTLGSNYKTKGEASAALTEYFSHPYDLDNKDITFSQLYEVWFVHYMEYHESYRYRIKSAYKYCSAIYDKKVRDISILDMKNCIYKGTALVERGKYRGQTKAASPSTKQSIKILLNNMFSYAVEARITDRNYAREFTLDKKVEQEKIQEHKVKIPFSEDELNKLWKSIEFVPFADMIVYACYSGWRPGELIRLKVKDVNWEDNYIEGGIKTKAGKNRLVPIHSLVKPIVEKYYNEAVSVGSEYLFNDITKKTGIGLSRDQYLSRFNKVMERLHFRLDLTPHYTRHTFITKAKSRQVNMNDYILKLIVGHSIKDITEHVYTHREIQDLQEEIEKIKS